MSRGRPTLTESKRAIVLISSQELPRSKHISAGTDKPAFDRASNRERETEARRAQRAAARRRIGAWWRGRLVAPEPRQRCHSEPERDPHPGVGHWIVQHVELDAEKYEQRRG